MKPSVVILFLPQVEESNRRFHNCKEQDKSDIEYSNIPEIPNYIRSGKFDEVKYTVKKTVRDP